MTRTRIVLAAGAVAGVIGLSLGAAGIASAASPTPTTTPSGAAKAAPANGNCPNMGGAGGGHSTTPSTGGSNE